MYLDNSVNIINELNDITIPLSCKFFSVSKENKPYYWRIPSKFKKEDNLKKLENYG